MQEYGLGFWIFVELLHGKRNGLIWSRKLDGRRKRLHFFELQIREFRS